MAGQRRREYMQGLGELMEEVGQLTEQAAAALKEGTRECAELIVREAKARVPVDTGALKESLEITENKSTKNKRSGHTVKIGKMAKKWHGMVEIGTSKMPARPFLRPAFDDNKERIASIIIGKLKDVIR
jgi:HK97 gp10 family phage protein